MIQGAAVQCCVTFTLILQAMLAVKKKKKKKVSYMKILNGNFPLVLEFPHLPFRTKSGQGQAGAGDRLCCMGSKQKGKRQAVFCTWLFQAETADQT